MEISYLVSKENYIETIQFVLSERQTTPRRMLWLFLTTIGQMSVVVWYQIFYHQPLWQRIVLITLSLLVAEMNWRMLKHTKTRANGVLREMEHSGKLPKDFWEQHTLTLKDNILVCRYGTFTQDIPCQEISRIVYTDTLVLLFSTGNIFDVIPCAAVAEADLERFLQRVDCAAYSEEIKRVDDLRNKAEGEATYKHIYTVRREELADIFTAAKRNSYRFRCSWSKKELKMAILGAAVLIYGICTWSVRTFLPFALLAILLNFRVLIYFTRLYRYTVIQKIAWPEMTFVLTASEETLGFFTDRTACICARNDICGTYQWKEYVFLYERGGSILIAPITFIPEKV